MFAVEYFSDGSQTYNIYASEEKARIFAKEIGKDAIEIWSAQFNLDHIYLEEGEWNYNDVSGVYDPSTRKTVEFLRFKINTDEVTYQRKTNMKKNCKQCDGPIERGPRANNKKFCSPECRQVFSYESGSERARWTRANGKEAQRRAKYAPGKIQCLECLGWYRAPVMHAWQKHCMTEADYKKKHGLDHGKGLLIASLKEKKSEQVFENGTVKNLKKGKSHQFKKGDHSLGTYKRSKQTMERLKMQFKVYGK